MQDSQKLNRSQAREARQKVEDYWQKKLVEAQASIRNAFKEFDRGKLDAFDVDEIIVKYLKRSKDIDSSLNIYRWSNENMPKILKMIQEEEKGNP
ncbi:MAG TPA: hypothetical protein VMR34_02790 [Candidatus Saccharimonadales bacterium]|nr:hypothetical protein [Candidatus Saccharimonadales bacterium]